MRSTGDPITAALGGRLPPDQLAQRIHQAGYDRPLLVQYGDYLGGILHGDFGTTISDRRPVLNVLTTFGTATLELAVYALVVALLVGIPLGRLADPSDHAALAVFLAGGRRPPHDGLGPGRRRRADDRLSLPWESARVRTRHGRRARPRARVVRHALLESLVQLSDS